MQLGGCMTYMLPVDLWCNPPGEGDVSCLQAVVTLQRVHTFWLATIYLPSFTLLLISCLALWIPPVHLIPRTLLLLVLLLILMPVILSSQILAPGAGYLKAVDVWLVVCFLFLAMGNIYQVTLNAVSAAARTKRDSFELMVGVVRTGRAEWWGRPV